MKWNGKYVTVTLYDLLNFHEIFCAAFPRRIIYKTPSVFWVQYIEMSVSTVK